MDDESRSPRVLDSKRDATRYRVLVEIADRQPAVSQGEVADAVGVTSQAISEYVRDLVETGYLLKHGRGRYEVTKEGVDWLISRTDALEQYVDRVGSDVLGSVDVDAAVATHTISEGDTVELTMQDGILHATPGRTAGGATATAVTSGGSGTAIGVSEFDGFVDYETGFVTAVPIPPVTEADPPDPETIHSFVTDVDRIAIAGTEAYAAVRAAGLDSDIRFATPEAVCEAALRGLDICLFAVSDALSRHTTRLREEGVRYDVRDPLDVQ